MDLKEYLQEKQKSQRIDEIFALLGVLSAAFLVRSCIKTMTETNFLGSLFKNLAKPLGGVSEGIDGIKNGMDKGNDKSAKGVAVALSMAGMAEQAIKDEDDKTQQGNCAKLLAAFRTATVNDDGTLTDPSEWAKRFEQTTGTDPSKALEQTGLKGGDSDEDKLKSLNETLSKYISEGGTKGLNEAVAKNKSQAAEYVSKIKDIMLNKDPESAMVEISSMQKVADLKREYQAKMDALTDEDAKKDLEKEMNEKIDKEVQDRDNKLKEIKDRLEKEKEPQNGEPQNGEPQKGNDDDIKAAEETKKKLDERSAAIEKEMKDLEGKTDDESKKKLEDLKKEQEDIQKQKKDNDAKLEELKKAKSNGGGEPQKGGDPQGGGGEPQTKEIDGEKFTLKDGKWVNKDGETMEETEVTDKDGNKVKKKVYTGPQGGRYYWSDDKKTKIYLNESYKGNITLYEFLISRL